MPESQWLRHLWQLQNISLSAEETAFYGAGLQLSKGINQHVGMNMWVASHLKQMMQQQRNWLHHPCKYTSLLRTKILQPKDGCNQFQMSK